MESPVNLPRFNYTLLHTLLYYTVLYYAVLYYVLSIYNPLPYIFV